MLCQRSLVLTFLLVGLMPSNGQNKDCSDVRSGPRGLPGPVGPAGLPGPPGLAGLPGLNGPPGRTGLPGPVGPTGLPGRVGPRGLKGSQGSQGLNGEEGMRGKAGPAGPVGLKGPKGQIGPAGPRGFPGIKGQKGETGLGGPPGLAPAVSEIQKLIEEHISQWVCPCSCILRRNQMAKSGVYYVRRFGSSPFQVYCDMDTDGGGWTVFQRRKDSSVDFYRGWNDYKNGFGSVDGEFWLGLDKISWLLGLENKKNQLEVELKNERSGKPDVYADYADFNVGSECTKYILSVKGYSGTAGDRLAYHNGMKFTTKDNDNDQWGSNCAVNFHGGWWYKDCHYVNLNGGYQYTDDKGIRWNSSYYKSTEMKFR